MNAERELELQAYVDGELSPWRAGRVRRQVAADPEAQRLVAELSITKGFLAGNEAARTLPEAPDFYWNRIRQQIERAEQVEEPAATVVSWRRILAPLAGVAMAVLLAIVGFNWMPSTGVQGMQETIAYVAEVENLSENTDSLSFRSSSENMFVVWVHDKSGETASDAEVIDEDEDFPF